MGAKPQNVFNLYKQQVNGIQQMPELTFKGQNATFQNNTSLKYIIMHNPIFNI